MFPISRLLNPVMPQIVPPRVPVRMAVSRPLGLALCLTLVAAIGLRGAEESAGTGGATVKSTAHRSSLGVTFQEVPGTPVLFSVYETRVSDWAAFQAETNYKWSGKPHFPQTGDHPVVNINLRDALKFCEWLTEKERAAGLLTPLQSYRLPTSREWDATVGLASLRRAERATSQKVIDEQSFPWGLEWPPPAKAGNFNSVEINGTDDGFPYTAPVGSFAASKEGLHDLAGNVWEWVWDPEAGNENSARLRGGSWMYFRKECLLASYQYDVPADLRAPTIGFRMVLEDKHRTAIFLAHQDQIDKELEKKRLGELMTRPSVDAGEVARMREQLTAKPAAASDAPALPDPKSLKPAAPGAAFTNSLDMTFRPAGNDQVLFSTQETRVQDYQVFLAATKGQWDRKPSFEFKPNHPIMNITWSEARAFCDWLTERERSLNLIPAKAAYRLPSDLEWSVAVGLSKENGADPAARHRGNKSDFPWGQQPIPPPASANLDTANMAGYQDNYSHTAPVGSFSTNAFGLSDMAGNVTEWCEDSWPGASNERVLRGSSFLSSARDSLLSSDRQHAPENMARSDVGFRCVLDLQPH
jgi:formylglycine-generating enzyme required for sulfatase activity